MLQLIYASAAVKPFSPADLKTLLARARAKNALYQVSGMLLYHNGSFLQVLEGQPSAVDIIYRSVSADPRHVSMKMLLNHQVPRREFPAWSMGFVDTAASNFDPPPLGLVDYQREMQDLTIGNTRALRFLRFFHQGLCRQQLPTHS